LTLNLRGNPSRLGISWRTDDAEPGVVIVNRVVPGSAAEMAGVRVGDRIYRINGQTFADAEAFRQAATQATGPIVLETERAGQVRSAELPSADAPPMSDADA
jgi:C-terminal processing protease CtpA/Prc